MKNPVYDNNVLCPFRNVELLVDQFGNIYCPVCEYIENIDY
jgi:uncharacterized Zn finger protein (UPF0148 family)